MRNGFWRLGLRSLWRDLRLLIVAVTLAVAALTAVGFFADRLQGGLQRDARQLLGGDVVLSTDNPVPRLVIEKVQALGLASNTTISFPTMARASDAQGGANRLVALKAVTQGYPLRGRLSVAASVDAPGTPTDAVPASGEVWVDASLLEPLGLRVGDSLLLGDARLTIARIIVAEPDRGSGFASFSPRVMLNQADLPATGLVQPASRISYRFAVAGSSVASSAFGDWIGQLLETGALRGARLETLESGRSDVRQTLDRAEKFLHLVALLAAMLSAVAVALAARGFAARHLDDCAMLRVLGLGQRAIALAYLVEFGLVGVVASALGVAIGLGVHHVFVALLAGLVAVALPAPSWWPVGFGLGIGLTLLAAFGLPPVLQLARVPPLRVIRRDVGNLQSASLAVLALGVAGFAALLLAASRDLMLGLIAVGGFSAAVLLFAGLSWLAVRLLRAAVNEATAPRALVLATRQLCARPAYAVVQVSALAVGLLALILLVLLRTDLISSWRQATPADAPNRIVINLMPEQAAAFQQRLRAAGVRNYDWYPMVRGRLVAVNGRPLVPDELPDERARHLADREFNLSYSASQPPHNTIVAGKWVDGEAGAISVEEGIARTLGLKLGDTLRFEMAGVPVESRITSLRKVDWASMRANFYALYPVGQLPDVPATYMSAFKAPAVRGFDNALVHAFPNITNVDIGSMLAQVQRILDQVVGAVEFLFAFTLAAGLLVLFAAVSATREERAREFAVMRAVGAQARLLRQVQRVELAGVGVLAGVLAALVAMVVGWLLARYVFNFNWSVAPWVPLAGGLAGALLAMAAGWWGLRDVLRRPVVETLRSAPQ